MMQYKNKCNAAYYLFIIQIPLLTTIQVQSLKIPSTVRRPPTITKQSPEIYYALPRAQIRLVCAADGYPDVKQSGSYIWKKDGKYFNITEEEERNKSMLQISMSDVDGSLYFNGSEKLSSDQLYPHEGKYQCFASNQWGTTVSKVIELKIGTMAPYIGIADEVLEVKEGESKQVSCRRSESKDIATEWKFIPNKVQLSNRIAQAYDGTIVFSNIVAVEDEGLQLFCTLKYLPTRSSIDGVHYTLSVKTDEAVRDSLPKIVQPRQDRERKVVLKGEELKLTCIATGKPTPSVYWNKKAKLAAIAETYEDYYADDDYLPGEGEEGNRFLLRNFNRTLYIREVNYTDEGDYTCTVKNKIGIRRRDIEVIVEAKPSFASDYTQPFDMIKVPGETAEIRCEPEGKPEPEVVWMKNGKPIDDLPSDMMFNKRIVLKDLKQSDTAVYQCMGKNKHGTVLGQGFLNVLISEPVALPENKIYYRRMEGNAVDLQCDMFSSPNHTTTWVKFEQPQKNLLWDERIEMKSNRALKIRNINIDDSGIYECRGSNNHGTTAINITLLVLEKTIVRPTGEKDRYVVPKGQDVAMSVETFTDGNLKWSTVTWYKDGYNMSVGIQLKLLSVSVGDSGEYNVVVQTEFDTASTTIRLIVQDVPDEPTGLTFTADENDPYSGTLNWESPTIDNNSPVQSYDIEYEASELYPGRWVYVTTSVEPRINVEALEPWVEYSFRVWAENGIGLSEYPSEATEPYKTPASAPRINPAGVSGAGTSPDNMVIKWDKIDVMKYAGPGFGYEVSWCMESNCTWQVAPFIDDPDITSYIVTGTPPYTRYLINVTSANDEEGKAPAPIVVVGYSGEDVPMESPSEVTHTISDYNDVTVSWKPVPDEKMRGLSTGYIVEAKEKNSNKSILKEVDPNELTTNLKLDPFTDYEITVSATNKAGPSKPSKNIELKTPEGKPDAPENFAVTKTTLNDLQMQWKEPTKVKGVIISYRLQLQWMNGNETKSDTRETKKMKVKLTGLQSGAMYNMTLCAETSRGIGDDCATIGAKTLEPRSPGKARYNVITDDNLANVSWETPEQDLEDGIPVRSFRVEYRLSETDTSKENEEKWESSKIKNATESWHYATTINDLIPGTFYEFRIVAANEFGETVTNSTKYKTTGRLYREAGGGIVQQPWFLVLLCVLALLIVFLAILCFMRRRKGGKYAVSEKEEQLVKLESQPMNNDEAGKYNSMNLNTDMKEENGMAASLDDPLKSSRRPRGDSVGGNSIEAFGSGDTKDFEEDGSFIDQYGIDRRSQGKSEEVSSPASDESKDVDNAQTRLLRDSDPV
ncbi:neuronal cell adhesion molecule-like [Styela clava]